MAFKSLHSIISEIIDSKRSTGEILSYTDNGDGTYTYDSLNSIPTYQFITIEDESVQVIASTSTTFTIKKEYATATEWKAEYPYFMHEKEPKAFQVLTEKTKAKDLKFKKYPLVLLTHPYPENQTGFGDYSTNFRLAILNHTDENYYSDDRYENNFDTVLTPIYNDIIDGLCEHVNVAVANKRKIDHEKTDNLYINGNPLPDVLDGIIVEFNNIVVCNSNRCPVETVVSDTFDVTTSTVGTGTIESNPTSLTGVKKNTLINLFAIAGENYRFVNWTLNGISKAGQFLNFFLTQNITAIANFIRQWTLTITQPDNGTITCDTAAGLVDEGATVNASLAVDEGYKGTLTVNEADTGETSLSFLMSANKALGAIVESLITSIKTPTEFTLTVLDSTSIKLDWVDSLNALTIQIERSTDGVDYSIIDTVDVGTQTYSETITAATVYYYRIKALRDVIESNYSEVVHKANFYVRTDGSSTAPYDTPAKAHTSIITVLTYIKNNRSGQGDILDIGVGEFVNYIYLDNANLSNLQIIGQGDETVINLSSAPYNSVLNSLANNAAIKKLKIIPHATKPAVYITSTSNKLYLDDITIMPESNHGTSLIYMLGASLEMTNSRLYEDVAGNSFYLTGTANLTARNTVSLALPNAIGGNSWSFLSSGTVNIINCNILDSTTHGIIINNAGCTCNITNSIISGGYFNASSYPILKTNGTLNLSHNLIIGNIVDASVQYISGSYNDLGGNVFANTNPKFKSYIKDAFILPRVDDSVNVDYAKSLGELLATYNYSGTYYLNSRSMIAGTTQKLIDMVLAGGMEVGSHGRSHTDMSVTGKLLDVTKGLETITIDRTADTITISGGGVISGFKSMTISEIILALEALGATVTPSSIIGTGSGYVSGYCLGEVFANVIDGNQIDLLIDVTANAGYFYSEIKEERTTITNLVNSLGMVNDPQTGNEYECRTFGYPYQNGSLDSRLATINAGHAAASCEPLIFFGTPRFVGQVDLYSIPDVGIGLFVGADETETRIKTRSLLFAAKHVGLVIAVTAHTTSDATMEEWGWVLDEISNYGNINVLSRQKFADTIRTSWLDNEDGTFTKTFSGICDYELLPDSELIGIGEGGSNIGAI